MKYKVMIGFEKERHCLQCPLRDWGNDGCNLQRDEEDSHIEFDSWEKQMENCPLVGVSEDGSSKDE